MHQSLMTLGAALALALVSTRSDAQTLLPPDASTALEALESSTRAGQWVEVTRANAPPLRTWVVYPEGDEKAAVVILIHGNRGLVDWVRAAADRLAAAGFIALAPDLLSGKGPSGGGFTSIPSSDDARHLMGELTSGEVEDALDAAWSHAESLARWSGKAATMGICSGGGVAFRYATTQPALAATVVFYGPSPDSSALASIGAPVLGLYGGDDARVNATIPDAAAEMTRLGKIYEQEIYDGAGHAFLQRQTERDGKNRSATEKGWPRAIEFLKRHLS